MLALLASPAVDSADLPPHRPLRVLIVSDEVNPHGLLDHELTQPGDISATLLLPETGLRLDAVTEIATNDIEQATALLGVPLSDPDAHDVLIYFAHRIPDSGADPVGRQQAFTLAVEAFLQAGGGVISFHHGSYAAAGKEGILDLIIGATANAVAWNTVAGQDVINTAPERFVTCNGVVYPNQVTFGDAGLGVASASYPVFNNTPDERYPVFPYNPSAAGNVETIFASDYNQSGTAHLLGFIHQQPAWQGVVVGYQPGEYQPNALDDLSGNNFQILANAIVFAAGMLPADEVVLEVQEGPMPQDVSLQWWACGATVALFRSEDPATITDPANEITQTTLDTWIDTPPEGDAFYYRVVK